MGPLVVVLTGSGISAESGLSTFRDAGGLWEGHPVEDVASPDAYSRNPNVVHRFYDARRAQLSSVAPNPAHLALARLEKEVAGRGESLLLVTQNVDDLHERAGSKNLIHMHGELTSAWCTACDTRTRWIAPLGDRPPCPTCGQQELRPDIVWFGEEVYAMPQIVAAVSACKVFVVAGTSGTVFPAAGLASRARHAGARTVLLNLEPQGGGFEYDQTRLGPACEVVPAWVEEFLGELRY